MGICNQKKEQEKQEFDDINQIAKRFSYYKGELDKIKNQQLKITDDFSDQAVKNIMQNSQNRKMKKALMLKKLVSKSKIRYQDEHHNLDLAYISKQIIAMGFPSIKFESIYRNSRQDTRSMLSMYHGKNYKVYNLCLEKKWDYDNIDFDPNIVIAKYPFRDHCPCDILLMLEFCIDVILFLNQPEDGESQRGRAVAVHCKAGKGRTGVMICAYLIFCGVYKTVEEALQIYGERRSKKRKGITINSQRRFIYYFDAFLKQEFVNFPYVDRIVPLITNPSLYYSMTEKLNLKGIVKSVDIGPIKQQ